MSNKRDSIAGKLGWGLAADIFLFALALLIMNLFAIGSMANAYVIALCLLVISAVCIADYKKRRKRTAG